MRLILALALTLCACRPSGPPEGTLEPVAEGIAVAQAPAPATRGAARDATDACAEPGLEVYADAPVHYLALPGLWITEVEEPYRQAQVVRMEGGCQVVAVFPADDQPPGTGGRSCLPERPDIMFYVGFLFELVDVGDELWLFANTSTGFWRIDPNTGVITHDDALEGFPVGAVADPDGGAWVTTSPVFADQELLTPARLWHLDPITGPGSDPVDLPFDDYLFSLVGDDGQGNRVPRFVFHPVAVTRSGEVWVLDSDGGVLFEAGSGRTMEVGLVRPTGLAAWGDNLVVTVGADVDRTLLDDQGEPAPELFQAPGLYFVDLSTEQRKLVSEIPEGSVPWTRMGGFWGTIPTSQGDVAYDVWFPLAQLDDTIVMADPTFGRVFTLDPPD